MNCKIGGAPWTTSNPPACQDLMVVGFDTSKDSINKGVAFGAIVASMNDSFSQYFSQVGLSVSIFRAEIITISINLVGVRVQKGRGPEQRHLQQHFERAVQVQGQERRAAAQSDYFLQGRRRRVQRQLLHAGSGKT